MQPWKTLARRTILNHSKYLSVEEHEVLLPDGRIIPDWPWIVTPDYANVVAVTEAGQFLVFRQNKYAVDGTSLAPVGGYLEPGEDPFAAAQRELLEETGFTANEWIDLGHYVVGGNRGIATGYLYLALDAVPVTAPDADDLEEMELLLLGRDEVDAALRAGDFKVMSWATAMALALLRV
ncbi:MAG TPA: NUDIX hydrolase [Anaerolineae bacterium]|mgnify:CR=1 FL=1|nr:NUDIX hydrolase [Anaerolineae bacterium]